VWGQAVGGGYGVSGSSDTGVGVWGSSANRYGGQFSGVAPLYLVPNDYPGPPGTLGSGQYEKGAIYVDYYGSLYVCIASGNPGVWHRITSVVPITPVRVMNTRPGKQIGPYLGPIHSNTVLTLTLAGTNGIPGNATGVVGNLTAADATGSCFLAVVPSGVSHTGVSTINFPAQAQGTGVANAFMVGLSNSGKIDIYTGNCSSYTVNIIVDITGYIV
jgi:hypothetical protein